MKIKNSRILLVEDDDSLGYLLSEYLKYKDFEVSWAKTGNKTLQLIEEKDYDLVILDVMLPDIDGYGLATRITANYPELPFIFLTARSLKVDVLKGFSLGAIDYLKKPIDEEELVARIQALLSRIKPNSNKYATHHSQRIGEYTFHSKNRELVIKTEVIRLTERENALLLFLVQHQNSLCSHKEILGQIWGKNDYFTRKSLNVFISHLRKYLSQDPSISIENRHRKGFILRIDSDK